MADDTRSIIDDSLPGEPPAPGITRIVLDESMVADWLDNHPDFFDRHSDVLSNLDVRHRESGGAASLIERQVQTLRERLAVMEQRFEDMVTTARENEQLQERLHRVSLAATGAASLDAAIETIPDLLKEEFEIEHVALCFVDQVPSTDMDHWTLLHDRVSHGKSICDDRLPERVLAFLFDDASEAVNSCAVLPLPGERGDVLGVIGLGSIDPVRFNHAMGTLYLDRLGEIVSSGLHRLRNNARAA